MENFATPDEIKRDYAPRGLHQSQYWSISDYRNKKQYENINNLLWGNESMIIKEYKNDEDIERLNNTANDILNLCKSVSLLNKPVKVYRATDKKHYDGLGNNSKYQHKSLMSTSIIKKGTKGHGNAVATFTLPEGTPVLYMGGIDSNYNDEEEMLVLPCEFNVDDIEKLEFSNPRIMNLKEIMNESLEKIQALNPDNVHVKGIIASIQKKLEEYQVFQNLFEKNMNKPATNIEEEERTQ